MSDIARRMIVSGRVQGVNFRHSCLRRATELGVRGWVRNAADGTVEVIAEGPRDAVEHLLEWCRHGPPYAHVTGVEVTPHEPAGAAEFRVRR